MYIKDDGDSVKNSGGWYENVRGCLVWEKKCVYYIFICSFLWDLPLKNLFGFVTCTQFSFLVPKKVFWIQKMKTSLAIFIFSKNEDNGIFVKNQKYVGLHTQLYAYIFCNQKETSSLSPRHDQFLSLGWVQHWFGFFSFGTKLIEFGGCESRLWLWLWVWWWVWVLIWVLA